MRFIFTLLITLNASLVAQDNWSQFRGPATDGHSRGALPLSCSG